MYNNYRDHIGTERLAIINRVSKLVEDKCKGTEPPFNDLGITRETIINVLKGNYSISTIFKLEVLFEQKIIGIIAEGKNVPLVFDKGVNNAIQFVGGIGDLRKEFTDELTELINEIRKDPRFIYRSTRQYLSINYIDPNFPEINTSIHICFFRNFRNKVKLELNIPNSKHIIGVEDLNFIEVEVDSKTNEKPKSKKCKLKGDSGELEDGFRYHIYQTPNELKAVRSNLVEVFKEIKNLHINSLV